MVTKGKNAFDIWKCQKVFCIITYFPFISVFQNALVEILSTPPITIDRLKIRKIEKISSADESVMDLLDELDGDSTNEFIKTGMKEFMQEVKNIFISMETSSIKIPFPIGTPKNIYVTPDFGRGIYEEANWGASLTFSSLTLDGLLFLVFSLLTEKRVVLVSSNLTLLTATMFTLNALLRPFNWPHPCVYNLPEMLFPYFDSPVPVWFGLNMSTEKLAKSSLLDHYPNTMFFYLEYESIGHTKSKVKRTCHRIPSFDDFLKPLAKEYFRMNPRRNQVLASLMIKKNIDILKKLSNKELGVPSLVYNPNHEESAWCSSILGLFSRAFSKFVVEKIPKEVHLSKEDERVLDLEKYQAHFLRQSRSERDRAFFQKFLKTQIFTFFLEEHYQFSF